MGQTRALRLGPACLLLAVTALVYSPSLRGGFLWDDDAYIGRNQELTNAAGLRRIWLTPGSTQQYYPLTFTTFWIEYHLWGLRPIGYHLVNVLLHVVNAMLVWVLLEFLGVSGAWIAAWLFALHPVQVESVAWMTELKNVLSTFFYLSAALFLLKSRGEKPIRVSFYAFSLVLFLCALLSKSVTATFPVVMLLIGAWISGSWERKEILRLFPFLAMGLVVGLFTLHYEHRWVGAQGIHWALTWPDRFIIAGRAFWFYLVKLLYPSPLIFIYPRWTIDPRNLSLYLYPMAALLLLVTLACGRKWWGKLPFAGLLFFVVTLSPVLGLTSFYFMRFSFVADHFQYLACIGVFAWAGWALSRLLNHLDIKGSWLGRILVGMLCMNLALATARAARKYADPLHLWQETLEFNPDSAIAHHNMGIAYSEKNQWGDALAHLRTAEALDPTYPQTHLALAYFAVQTRRWDDARHQYQEAIRLGIRDPQILKDYASLPPPHAPAEN
jgi:hypothetical protein